MSIYEFENKIFTDFTHVKFAVLYDSDKKVKATFLALINTITAQDVPTPDGFRLIYMTPIKQFNIDTLRRNFFETELNIIFTKVIREI